MRRSSKVVAIAIAGTVLALSGCGRRGALESPAGSQSVQTAAGGAPSKYSLDGGKREATTVVTAPKDTFILDPLL